MGNKTDLALTFEFEFFKRQTVLDQGNTDTNNDILYDISIWSFLDRVNMLEMAGVVEPSTALSFTLLALLPDGYISGLSEAVTGFASSFLSLVIIMLANAYWSIHRLLTLLYSAPLALYIFGFIWAMEVSSAVARVISRKVGRRFRNSVVGHKVFKIVMSGGRCFLFSLVPIVVTSAIVWIWYTGWLEVGVDYFQLYALLISLYIQADIIAIVDLIKWVYENYIK